MKLSKIPHSVNRTRVIQQISSISGVPLRDPERFFEDFDESPVTESFPYLLSGCEILDMELKLAIELLTPKFKKGVLDKLFDETPDKVVVVKQAGIPIKQSLHICVLRDFEEAIPIPPDAPAILGREEEDGCRKIAFPLYACF